MELLLFGIAREIIGTNKLIISKDDEIENVSQLKNWLKKKYPELKALTSMAVAVNGKYAEEDEVLNAGSEIAFIPPVSGG